ncbi:SUMF1/EgtB/PvdO family nonheme iron enzyme [Chloroflexales bacterium ZM16-3]|nr:SUMF1/EgtB/PvdO family nonheme iron enzyme [Chloroflexales bacterium ZM16-3]
MNDDELNALAAKLRDLHAEFDEATARAAFEKKAAGLLPDQRARVEALVFFGVGNQIGEVKIDAVAGRDVVKDTQGTATNSGTVYGAAVGVSTGTIQLFFGTRPPEHGAQLLNAYLDALGERYRPLALGHLLTSEQTGNEQAVAPTLPLSAVYTALATDARVPRERFALTPKELDQALAAADPDQVPPDRLRFPVADIDSLHEVAAALRTAHPGAEARSLRELWGSLRRATPRASGGRNTVESIVGQWYEPELAGESLAAPRSRIVLLGNPGSGKSTVLRYLVVCIADALRAGQTTGPAELRGWAGRPLPVPIFCPLGPVAKALGDDPASDLDQLVDAVLHTVFGPAGLRAGLRDTLLSAWSSGGVLLCFDGLDEVIGTPEPTREGPLSRRERLADALRRLAQEVGDSRVVVTCRTKPYQQDTAWQLPSPWQVRQIEPFAFGQVRFFVETWYTQSCAAKGAKLTTEEGRRRAAELLTAIPAKQGLRDICDSPLLLTMVVLLHYNQKQLPDERAEVYEALVGLLLDRWEWVRSSEKAQVRFVPFGERLALPQLRARDLRTALNEIAYTAHCTSQDGSGVITEELIYKLLEPKFRNALNAERPERVSKTAWTDKVERFLDLLVRESGLIQPDSDTTYRLPHLTFEEYLAACALAEQEDVEVAHARWRAGGDRWREPLLLLMGCLRLDKKHRMADAWLTTLLDEIVGQHEKSLTQRQRDAVLAAACYRELGGRRYIQDRWHTSKVDALEARLRAALLAVLEQPAPEILLPLRIEAGAALGQLGDPRIPVTPDAWQRELGRRGEEFAAAGDHYWRYVRPETYQIGGWNKGEPSAKIALPAFWLARFPLTVAQYAPFVADGYGPDAERWWTPEGWAWKDKRTQPWGWDKPEYRGLNQPVIGVTWYEATAFFAWLTEQLQDTLPKDYVVRLPTEAEWEAAAAYDAQMQRQMYPWGDEEPTLDRAIYDASALGRPAPVGSPQKLVPECSFWYQADRAEPPQTKMSWR